MTACRRPLGRPAGLTARRRGESAHISYKNPRRRTSDRAGVAETCVPECPSSSQALRGPQRKVPIGALDPRGTAQESSVFAQDRHPENPKRGHPGSELHVPGLRRSALRRQHGSAQPKRRSMNVPDTEGICKLVS